MRAGQVWRGRRIAPAHEGPRNESNNKADEPTSDRSTHCGSGHLIRFSVTLSTSFHRYTRAVLFLSRFAHSQGLVALCQTFVLRCHAAIVRAEGSRTSRPPFQPSPAVRSTIPPGHRARLYGGEKRHTRTRVLLHLDFRV